MTLRNRPLLRIGRCRPPTRHDAPKAVRRLRFRLTGRETVDDDRVVGHVEE